MVYVLSIAKKLLPRNLCAFASLRLCVTGLALGFWLAVAFLRGGVAIAQAAPGQDWPVYLGDKANTHYSALKQINSRNVTRLQVA